jgi:GTP-binding protein HflX
MTIESTSYDTGERAILVHIALGMPVSDESCTEFRLLAQSAGAVIVAEITSRRDAPDPRLFLGVGKTDELATIRQTHEADLVIIDHALSPAQQRNLERVLTCRVVDRNGLILDIFARRARSFEGQLQVELAQLKHLSTRLVRGWTHLERQKGGIGLRGPGETQLETDRRLLGKRIAVLKQRLSRIEKQRQQSRRARDRAGIPTIALVGYTNTGKSTLFNRLTTASVLAADQLFATLDPTIRRVALPHAPCVTLADTVGFINRLPHELIAAFRSTLYEARHADLLLHVIDASAEERAERINDVEQVLSDIGAHDVPRINVFNKIDLIPDVPVHADYDDTGHCHALWLSAATTAGIPLLLEVLGHHFRDTVEHRILHLTPQEGALHAWLHAKAHVLQDQPNQLGGWDMEVLIAAGTHLMRDHHQDEQTL